jgi:hypothetical protein
MANRLFINSSKSSSTIVVSPRIRLGADVITCYEKLKNLGLLIKQDLTWDDQVNKICMWPNTTSCQTRYIYGISRFRHMSPFANRILGVPLDTFYSFRMCCTLIKFENIQILCKILENLCDFWNTVKFFKFLKV